MTQTAEQRAAANAERVEEYARDLVSGEVFRKIEASQRSRRSYHGAGPLGYRAYSEMLAAVARFARESDRHADVAYRIVHDAPLYNTEAEVLAKIADVLAQVCAEGYFDVVGAASPEPGRRSDHSHPTTLRWALQLDLLWTEITTRVDTSTSNAIGWCAQALLDREHVTVYQHTYPNIHAEKARVAEIRNARYW